jgi:hypothetical protein
MEKGAGLSQVCSSSGVDITLGKDITAPDEGWVLCAEQSDCGPRFALRVLGPVDEAGEVAGIEVAKTVDFVHHVNRLAELVSEAQRQLEVFVWGSRTHRMRNKAS